MLFKILVTLSGVTLYDIGQDYFQRSPGSGLRIQILHYSDRKGLSPMLCWKSHLLLAYYHHHHHQLDIHLFMYLSCHVDTGYFTLLRKVDIRHHVTHLWTSWDICPSSLRPCWAWIFYGQKAISQNNNFKKINFPLIPVANEIYNLQIIFICQIPSQMIDYDLPFLDFWKFNSGENKSKLTNFLWRPGEKKRSMNTW